MFKKIFATVLKNFKLILRSKISTIIIFGSPLLLMLLLGLGIKADMSNISIGYHLNSDEDIALFDSLSYLESSQNFNYINYEDILKCTNDVEKGRIHLCLDFDSSSDRKVNFYVDIAKSNLAYVLLDSLSSFFDRQSNHVGVNTLQEILTELVSTSTQISNKTASLDIMKGEISSLPYKIKEIRTGLTKITFDVSSLGSDYSKDFDKFNDQIDDYEDGADDEFDKIEGDLGDTRNELAVTLDSLYDKRDDRDTFVNDLDNSFEANDCETKQYSYVDFYDPEFIIPEDDDTYCTSVYSIEEFYMSETSDLDSSIEMLENFDARLAETEDDLGDYKDEIDDTLSDTKKRLREARSEYEIARIHLVELKSSLSSINTFKADATQSLNDAEEVLDKSISEIDGLLSAMTNVSDSLSRISLADAGAIINPIQAKYDLYNIASNKLESLFESILTLVVGFTCILLCSLIVIQERNSSAHFRNTLVGVPYFTIVVSAIITVTVISVIQANIILLLGKYLFGISGLDGFLLLSLIVFFGSILFCAIGALIATVIDSEENVILVSILSALGMFLVSGIFIPKEFFTEFLYTFTGINPFILLEGALKQVIVYAQPSAFFSFLGLVLVEIFVLVFLSLGVFWLKKRASF